MVHIELEKQVYCLFFNFKVSFVCFEFIKFTGTCRKVNIHTIRGISYGMTR